jgi:serine phosphatase RsbU (regulator of sigma subunit)
VTLLVLIRTIIMVPSLYFGIALIWHSELYFPKEMPALLAKRWIRYVGYGIALLFTVFSLLVAGPLSSIRGNFEVPATLTAVVIMFTFATVVRLASRKYRTAEYNKQRRAITVAGYAVAALSTVAVLLAAFRKSQELLGILGFIFVLFPLAYLYAIGRYRLLDMNLRVRRNIQYTVASIVWGGLVGVVFIAIVAALLSVNLNLPGIVLRGAAVELADLPKVPGESNPLERLIVVVAVAATWFVLWKVRKWGQGIIDAKYYRTEYDYRQAAKELAEMLATKLSMADLGNGLVEKIVGLMKLKRAAVFFFKDDGVCCCREVHGIPPGVWSSFCIKEERTLAIAVSTFKAGFSADLLPVGLKEQFREQNLKYLVPIRSKEHLIGLLVLGEKLSESPFTSDDIEFLSAASSQASVSIENAFLYEELAEKERMKHELGIARQIQLASLPQRTPEVPGLDIAGRSIPALEVGGDFFDYLNGQQGHLTVVVGDVSGKGTSAALYMSKVQGIIRSLHGLTPSLAELFTRANRLLCNDMEKKSFITAVGATFDTGGRSLVLARAGHLPLYRFCARSTDVETVTPKGLGLGLDNAGLFSSELEETTLRYDRGDILLFVTDGITEARNAREEEFGEDRLVQILKEHASCSATRLRDQILDEVRSFAGQLSPHDDQTVVVVKAV